MNEAEIHIEVYKYRKKIRRAKALLIFFAILMVIFIQAIMPSLFGRPYVIEISENYYEYSISSGFPLLVLWVSIILFAFFLPSVIYEFICRKLVSKYYSILWDYCDSVLFEAIMGYGSQFMGYSSAGIAMLKNYIGVLQMNEKNEEAIALIEKPSIARYLKRDKIYYQRVLFNVALQSKDNEKVEQHYTLLCEQLARSKRKDAKDVLRHIHYLYFMYKEAYEEAWKIKRVPGLFNNEYEIVLHHYDLGRCLYHLQQFDKAKEHFQIVIEKGNTLTMVGHAKEYVNKINTGKE